MALEGSADPASPPEACEQPDASDRSDITLTAEEIDAGVPQEMADAVQAAKERLDRHGKDAELYARLQRVGFKGAVYETVADELARYALAVMGGWLVTGHIFTLVRKKGIRLQSTDGDWRRFRTDPHAAEELANLAVAKAIDDFKRRGIADAGWTESGGASLKTYFMGGVIFAFPNALRAQRDASTRWYRERELALRNETAAINADARGEDHDGFGDDPLRVVAAAESLAGVLAELKPRERKILVASVVVGYSQEEIVELLNEPSARAVEGVLYRLRQNEKIRRVLNKEKR